MARLVGLIVFGFFLAISIMNGYGTLTALIMVIAYIAGLLASNLDYNRKK